MEKNGTYMSANGTLLAEELPDLHWVSAVDEWLSTHDGDVAADLDVVVL